MGTINKRLIRRLNALYKICQAGEKGFEAAAANVTHRGLKVLLKSYARQRAQFADALKNEIQHLGGKVSEKGSIQGTIHRGRIHILANFTIGGENAQNFVLNEATLGEEVAVKAYKSALADELPAGTRALLGRQYEGVQEAYDQVMLLSGRADKRLFLQLFDSGQRAEAAFQELELAGFTSDNIEMEDVEWAASVPESNSGIAIEAIMSGAVGGAIWGSIAGATAGMGALLLTGVQSMVGGDIQRTWAVLALGGTLIGALFGAILGLIVGLGISEEHTYLYGNSLKEGAKLLRLYTDNERTVEAAQVIQTSIQHPIYCE